MLDLAYARDLIVTGILFGFVTFVWSGMGQERPPVGVAWRIGLGLLSVAGLALVAVGVPLLSGIGRHRRRWTCTAPRSSGT